LHIKQYLVAGECAYDNLLALNMIYTLIRKRRHQIYVAKPVLPVAAVVASYLEQGKVVVDNCDTYEGLEMENKYKRTLHSNELRIV